MSCYFNCTSTSLLQFIPWIHPCAAPTSPLRSDVCVELFAWEVNELKRDRRHAHRAEDGRRRSARIADYRPVTWLRNGRPAHAWLVNESAGGLAMLVQAPTAPPIGAPIQVAVHSRTNPLRACLVARVTPESAGLHLLSAEYLPIALAAC